MVGCRRLAAGINTIVVSVAVGTLNRRDNDVVVEYPPHTEACDIVADTAIDDREVHDRMTVFWPLRIRAIVTVGATTLDSAVVGITTFKRGGGVAETAITVGRRMGFMLANGGRAVMACGAAFGNTGMVIFSIRPQLQEAGGGVAVTAFGVCCDMHGGLTDSLYTIVASAALTKDFDVIGKAAYVKAEGGVAGLTHITGGDVIA